MTTNEPFRAGAPLNPEQLDRDLRAVCARHGLNPGPHEQISGWVALIDITGHDERDREYRRVVSLSAPGVTRIDVMSMLTEKLRMLKERVVHPRASAS